MAYVPNPVRHLRRVTLGYYLKYTYHRGIGVALLHEAHRHYGRRYQQQKSILWSGTHSKWRRIMDAVWQKGIGPTDVSAFPRLPYFFIFWLSQKFQAAGYAVGRLRLARKLRQQYRDRPR
jgi:hypothetical protein